ncbi:MAG TPA: phage portal protein [Planctomycetaceae bacterium]|nr:phage portal protein [Planctomycetaceae bacterium]
MFQYLRDCWQTAQLRAKTERLAQQRVLAMMESVGPEPVADDPGRWLPLGTGGNIVDEPRRSDLRTQARQLVHTNPYARNLLRLLEVYVAGSGLTLNVTATDSEAVDAATLRRASQLWQQFLRCNARHFSFRETARRTWRDGECFVRLYSQPQWPPTVRYIDPECIGSPDDPTVASGIITDAADIETVLSYQRIDVESGHIVEEIPAAEMVHIKVGVDSNEPRGVTIFAPVLESLASFDKWLEIELQARKLQASIVLWRKVQGGPSQAGTFADALSSTSGTDANGSFRRERYRPGTILTTSPQTELEFLQPQTNFGDAVPLGRMMLLGIAAGAGVPEFMITSDASNANFSSTMVAEGPAVKLFESEQQFFSTALEPLWRWVMREAIQAGLLPDVLEHLAPSWTFPTLVNRNRAKDRDADAKLVEAGILSRAEVGRRDGVDPEVMRNEIEKESL